MRHFLMILLAILLTSCAKDKKESGDMLDFIPGNSAVILKSNSPDLFFNNLRNNELLKYNKEYYLYEGLEDQLSLLKLIAHKKPAYLSFSSENSKTDFLFITEAPVDIIPLDSILNKQVETLSSNKWEIKKYTLDAKVAYTSTRNGIFLFSNSQELLQKSLEQEKSLKTSPDFQTTLRAASDKKPVIFINHDHIKNLLTEHFQESFLSGLNNFSHWTVVDTEITQSSIKLNGITTATDSVPRLIKVFDKTGISENRLAEVSPANSLGFYSISFTDFENLKENLRNFRGNPEAIETSAENDVLKTASEAGMVYLENETVFAIRTEDIETARLDLASETEFIENFRQTPVYNYTGEAAFVPLLEPLFSVQNLQFTAFLDNFIVFSQSQDALQEIIASYLNNSTLALSEAYISTSENLSTQASILAVSNNRNYKNRLAENLSEDLREATKNLNFEEYPIAAAQFIFQDGFAHVHAIINKSNVPASKQNAGKDIVIELGAKVATKPVFFKNHRTNGMDVAVQDEDNTLYLISSKGKIYWKKKLESRIQGAIRTVDILRNGRFQLAFATKSRLHVIDRDGNTVRPFPLGFNDPITQPLAIFDYENNRDYRFVVTQGRELYMYNRKGNRVKGFIFDKASEAIQHPPKHLRLGRKDYILVAEASGKLNILSRTGKIRIPVNEKLNLSSNEWYEHEGNFISSNTSGEIIKINKQGRINREATNLAENHQIAATEEILVSLSDNELKIGTQKVSLDFGLYTPPQIFNLNNRTFVSTTDLQASKVYVFNADAELLPGFPVYGNSAVDLGNIDADKTPEVTVQGDENSILLYDF